MGKRYVEHSDMCGCERCAREWDKETPGKVFDCVEDPNVLECGCDARWGCKCGYWDYDPRNDEDDG